MLCDGPGIGSGRPDGKVRFTRSVCVLCQRLPPRRLGAVSIRRQTVPAVLVPVNDDPQVTLLCLIPV